MKEDFLHYLWKFQKFEKRNLCTTDKKSVVIKQVGSHNQLAGPDFLLSRLYIDEQEWAGNVEIHIKSSDWYAHHHEKDPAYDTVILHVVWEHDSEIFRADNTIIPTLELKDLVAERTLFLYNQLVTAGKQRWINCENQIKEVPQFVVDNWLERMYFERLEAKATIIESLLEDAVNDWEAVFFQLLMKSFGSVINGEVFLQTAKQIPFAILRKCSATHEDLEALLYGQLGLLKDQVDDPYFQELKKKYQYLIQKYQLSEVSLPPVQFFRLRPPNFPTIRISQLSNLYYDKKQLFTASMEITSVEAGYKLFNSATSEFWETHYTFTKESSKRKKALSKSFIDLLLINVIIPMQFCYSKYQGKDISEGIIQLASQIAPEKNTLISKFEKLHVSSANALDTQALIQLKKCFCDANACISCAIGNHLLQDNKVPGTLL